MLLFNSSRGQCNHDPAAEVVRGISAQLPTALLPLDPAPPAGRRLTTLFLVSRRRRFPHENEALGVRTTVDNFQYTLRLSTMIFLCRGGEKSGKEERGSTLLSQALFLSGIIGEVHYFVLRIHIISYKHRRAAECAPPFTFSYTQHESGKFWRNVGEYNDKVRIMHIASNSPGDSSCQPPVTERRRLRGGETSSTEDDPPTPFSLYFVFHLCQKLPSAHPPEAATSGAPAAAAAGVYHLKQPVAPW